MSASIIADNIVSPLGATTDENYRMLCQKRSGINPDSGFMNNGIPVWASAIKYKFESSVVGPYTRFEKLCIYSAADALGHSGITGAESDTVFVLSTTKGNISLIGEQPTDLALHQSAGKIASHFGSKQKPVVVSNACISGLLAIIIAGRLLESGQYRNAVVIGADELSPFVVSGFGSLMALSEAPCRPFDKDRKGINLGEGGATVVMTNDSRLMHNRSVRVSGVGITNDANHISGPSRSGNELADAVAKALKRSGIKAAGLSFISAHGTATLYNDEMEAKAFNTAGLAEVPLHSLKGFYGHTLGAAGVIESVMSIHSLLEGQILPSLNFAETGTSQKVNVNTELRRSDKSHALKTASGFGGCNAAVVYSLQQC